MITIRPGSHVHTLLSILPFVGEYPMSALRLLGSIRAYRSLVTNEQGVIVAKEMEAATKSQLNSRFSEDYSPVLVEIVFLFGSGKCVG